MTENSNAPIYPGLPITTRNTKLPDEGPRTIPVTVDFSKGQTQSIDLQQLIVQSKISMVQSMYVDNSANNAAVTFVISGTGQTLVVPATSEAYLPILAPSPAVITVSSDSSEAIGVFINNFPVPAAVWNAQEEAFQFTNGRLQVTDVTLDALAVANGLEVVNNLLLTGGGAMPEVSGDQTFHTTITSANGTSAVTAIAAPGAGLAWCLTNLNITITGDATLSAGGEVGISVFDGATKLFGAAGYLPASTPSAPPFSTTVLQLNSINLPSEALNNALTVSLSVALTAGAVQLNGIYGLTPYIAG
jgi:hypothetical protein